jgi:hypothetical protein
MGVLTAPSSPVVHLMLPSPAIAVTFIYNFFQNNETVDDIQAEVAGEIPNTFTESDIAFIDNDAGIIAGAPAGFNINNFLAGVPRYVRFDFTSYMNSIGDLSFKNQPMDAFSIGNANTTEEELRAIEGSLVDDAFLSSLPFGLINDSSAAYTNWNIQDNNIGTELTNSILLKLELFKAVVGDSPFSLAAFLNMASDIVPGIGSQGDPAQDVGMGNTVPDEELRKFLEERLALDETYGDLYFDEKSGDIIGHSGHTFVSRIQLSSLIAGKFAGSILRKAASSPYNPLMADQSEDVSLAMAITNEIRSSQDPNVMSLQEYVISLSDQQISTLLPDALQKRKDIVINPNATPGKAVRPVGMLIEKYEVQTPNNVLLKRQSIVVGHASATSAVDLKIKVGTNYLYRPRGISEVTLPVYDLAADTYSTITLYCLSKPGPVVKVASGDPAPGGSTIPDDDTTSLVNQSFVLPPEDIRFYWDYHHDKMTMQWAFPVTRKNNIRYFKVFRRRTIYEPFQLLALYDFNESSPKPTITEYIRPSLWHKMVGNVSTTFLDPEFKKDSSFIYAVTAGAPAGNKVVWSNYSSQFRLSFNSFENSLKKKAVSAQGAPIPYPNFLMQQVEMSGPANLSTELVKLSHKKSFKLFFTPGDSPTGSALKILGQAGQADLNHVVYSSLAPGAKDGIIGNYYMTITNVDLAKTKIIPIGINKKVITGD